MAADTDYYGRAPQLFAELTSVLRALGLLPADDVAALERMTADVEAVRAWAACLRRFCCWFFLFFWTAGGR